MRDQREPLGACGFTLVELLVSSSVMVFILAGAYLCLESGLESQKLCERRMDIAQTARVALALLSSDLRNACPLHEDFEFVGMDRALGDMEADNLDFATHNYQPRAPGESDFCEVSYFVDRNSRTGEFGLWRRRDPTPDDEPLAGGSREEIAPGLLTFHLEYSDGFSWYESWGKVPEDPWGKATLQDPLAYNLSGLPEAVKITMAFSDPGELSAARLAGLERKTSEGDREVRSSMPLLFQTVVRLNLAGRVSSSASTGSQGSAPRTSVSPGTPPAESPGEGGN